MDTLLRVNNLSFKNPFTGEYILKNVSFEVRRGEIVTINGPSGSGKSALLKLINGYRELNIDSGEIELTASMVRVPQEPYSRLLHPTVKNILTQDGEKILNLCGKKDLLNKKTFHLSYGEKKLITLIHALSSKKSLIVLDEPFAGLDNNIKKCVSEEILKAKKRGKGFVIVDHTGTLTESDKRYYIDTNQKTLTDRRKKHPKKNLSGIAQISTDKETLLRLEKIQVKKGEKIIRFPDLEIREKSSVFITGRNGSGKTTLLKVIAGWEKKWQGEINFRGERWKKIRDRRGKIFFLTQIPETNFTGRTLKELAMKFKIDLKKIEEAGLMKNLHSPLIYLSYGEKIKVNLLIGDTLKPDLILIDETFSSLDSKSLETFLHFIKKWTEKGSGVIITSPESLEGSFSLDG